jgi:heptosyltransferase III
MHILIIRPGAIGDTLLTLPVIQSLREQYDASHITLVGNAAVLPLAHASGTVDEIYDYQEARWSRLFLTAGSGHSRDVKLDTILKRTQLAICWLRDPEGVVERNLRATGIPQVIVASGHPDPSTLVATHITTYLANTIGLSLQKPLHDFYLSLPDTTQYEAVYEGLVALHPGSGGARKCWPIECFAEVIARLWQQDRTVLVLAGPAEQERLVVLQSLLHAYPQLGRYEFLIDAPLLTIAQRLQECQCYIGNDSGLTHLASMLGLPTLALFGPSNPIIWHPPGQSVTILHEPVLEQLSVEIVMENFAPLLRSASHSPFGRNFTHQSN